ncbi:FabD/lysophospholipase-like protein [Viridothelium virens]|uniref:FabD/lysophospholipase-like protein n=1 Tax=Viridothelium virens TaxID=1048519 RepID=A0A6A6HK83_VIRVR|nr:FabD/lysophospholipase-like protein [Viridothelium virens]
MVSTITDAITTEEQLQAESSTRQNRSYHRTDAWNERNLLSLDGGGIRGIWTLLALERLMDFVAQVELNPRYFLGDCEELAPASDLLAAEHSFSPLAFPDHVSHGPFQSEEDARDYRKWKYGQRYLPCHYFDMIGGSSTGALIAIMLGRLRMPVSDCLYEYKTLGEKIFGDPRVLTQLSFIIIPRAKYDSGTLTTVFKGVVRKREEVSNERNEDALFPSRLGLCRTFVTAIKQTPSDAGRANEALLIRSYDNMRRLMQSETQRRANDSSRTQPGRAETDISLARPSRFPTQSNIVHRSSGESSKWQIWKVARAATAAPFYFRPLKEDTPVEVKYTDGGLQQNNNPTKEGIAEIEKLHRPNPLGAVISIGTSRGNTHSRLPMKDKLMGIVRDGANPMNVHDEINERLGDHPYYRLDDHGALKMELDEWKPRGLRAKFGKKAGSRTMRTIEHKFFEWVGTADNAEMFRNCAKELVRRRRARTMEEAKWAHYATGIRYKCLGDDCHRADFTDRDEFVRHLQHEHADEALFIGRNPEDVIEELPDEWRWSWQYPAPT